MHIGCLTISFRLLVQHSLAISGAQLTPENQQWVAGGSTDQLWHVYSATPFQSALLHEATNSKNVCVAEHLPHSNHLSGHLQRNQVFPVTSYPKQLFGLTGHFPSAQMLCLLLCDCHQLFHPYSSKQTRIIQPLIQRSSISLLSLSSEPKAGQIHQATCAGKPCAHQRLKSRSDFLERVL